MLCGTKTIDPQLLQCMEFLQGINTKFFAASFLLFSCLVGTSYAQAVRELLYFPEANAEEELAQAIQVADAEGKHVMIQVGGNWCGWCYKFHDYIAGDSTLSALLEANYVVLHLNYSLENKNEEILADLGYPQRFGFPVFVIMDGRGNRLHTQDSALLEKNNFYGEEKVSSFFKNWAPTALDPASYE